MLKEDDIHHHQDHLPLDEILGTLSAQLLEYCESDSIQDTVPSSEGTLELNCRSSDDPAEFCLTPDGDANDGSHDVVPPAGYNLNVVNTSISALGDEDDDGMASLSTIFDAREEEDISASIDFSTSPSVYARHANPHPEFLISQSERDDFSGVQHRIASTELTMRGMTHFPSNPAGSLVVTQLPSVVDVCLSSMPSCGNFLPPTNDMGLSFVHPNVNGANFCVDASGMVIGSMLGINGEMQAQDLDYCRGDSSGMFYHNSQNGIFNPGDMQVIGLDSPKLLGVHPTSVATEISNPDDVSATFKVGKLSPEERREKIDRYIRKRNERNFSKKIKYACRKTLADSRPRVRGRFAKNEEQGEASRHGFGHNVSDCHHDDDCDDEENPTATEILGPLSGLSSFNCSFPYPIMDLNRFSDKQLGTF